MEAIQASKTCGKSTDGVRSDLQKKEVEKERKGGFPPISIV